MEHEGLSLYLFERKAPLAFLNSLSSVKSHHISCEKETTYFSNLVFIVKVLNTRIL